MLPSAVSSSKRKFQVNDDPPIVLTPEKSTPPPLARKPIESTYKRKKVLNSKKGNNVNDQFHYGGAGGDCMLQQQQEVSSPEQIGKAAHDGIPNNDPFHKVGCTREAFYVGSDIKYKSGTKPRKQNYRPKINDRTKPKKILKSKKRVKARKNMHESRMPQTREVAEESIPLTPEPLDKKRLIARDTSWKTRSNRTSSRRALDFSNNDFSNNVNNVNNVEDENAALQVSTCSVANLYDVNEAGSVASFSDVNEANEPTWWSSNNNLQFEDFGSCIELREIIREHKGTKLTYANIEDLNGARSKIFRGYPKKKRSKKAYHKKVHKSVLNTDTVAVTSPACSSHDFNQMYDHGVQYGDGFSQCNSTGLESSRQCFGEPIFGRTETSISEDYVSPYTPLTPYGFDVPERLENNALILYGGRADLARRQEHVQQEREADLALIPHSEPKKRKPKASVRLSPNTIRVWNLLMENDAGLEGIDEPTKEWLKDETKQLSDRIDVFISRMNLFQGDRRFSRWGGSVLDSVIGVLLTQNVTDVLSSSAFMNLAAKYPSKIRRRQKKYGEFSRNEKAQNSHQPQDADMEKAENSPQNADMEDFSCRESVSESSSCSCSALPGPFSLPDLNFPPNLDSSYANLVFGVSSPPDCSSPSTSSEHTHKNLQPSNKDADESQNGASERKTTVDDYWYTIGREIATAKAKLRGKTSKIASRNNKVTSELEVPLRKGKEKQTDVPDIRVNWDELRTTYCTCKPRSYDSLDAVDWEAVQRASFEEVSKVIEERGMNNLIAGRIKDILDRLIRDHGSLDLEWLRDVPPIRAKDYLRSIGGIGLKSTECVRLLALEHHAFAVDTNIGRIAVRLGWVPLDVLPDGVLIHLLDKYPLVDNIQQYLWPRLQGLDQRKLYELHYHMITFGKVFCKKRRPNCNACPMKGECRHFASEYASEKLKLPAPNNEASTCAEGHKRPTTETPTHLLLEGSLSEPRYECAREPYVEDPPSPEPSDLLCEGSQSEPSDLLCEGSQSEPQYVSACKPFVEFPSSPEPVCVEPIDIEDLCSARDDEIPVIELNTEAFRQNMVMEMERRNCMQLDIILNESASIPMKKMHGLRTEHHVYELGDGHPILEGFVEREHDDPCPYLVKIWTPDEMLKLDLKIEEQGDQTVLGTILIPCKTANEGRFPLNGTYFQTNEVFADDETSHNPIVISRKDLWNRPRRLLYCSTSTTSMFTGVDIQTITYCFWRGFICTRGFDRVTKEAKPMSRVLHKTSKNKKEYLDE